MDRPSDEGFLYRAGSDTWRWMQSFKFWVFSFAVGLVTTAFGEDTGAAVEALIVLGYVGGVVVAAFAWHCSRAPFLQRNEARIEREALGTRIDNLLSGPRIVSARSAFFHMIHVAQMAGPNAIPADDDPYPEPAMHGVAGMLSKEAMLGHLKTWGRSDRGCPLEEIEAIYWQDAEINWTTLLDPHGAQATVREVLGPVVPKKFDIRFDLYELEALWPSTNSE